MRRWTAGLLTACLIVPGLAAESRARRDLPTQVAHTPWLAVRFEQDSSPVRLVNRDLRTTEVELAARPFRVIFPRNAPDIAYQLCAWTDDSIFRQLVSRATIADPNRGSEHPCFGFGTGMADTEAGSGQLMLNDEGHNYLIDLRLGPDPDRPSVYYSALWVRGVGERPIGKVRRPIYIIAFHDRDRDHLLDNGEYDFLVLRFRR
jgi:hypothetical protein